VIVRRGGVTGQGPHGTDGAIQVGRPSGPQEGKVNWSPRRDSNPRPLPYQGSALPTELRGPDCGAVSCLWRPLTFVQRRWTVRAELNTRKYAVSRRCGHSKATTGPRSVPSPPDPVISREIPANLGLPLSEALSDWRGYLDGEVQRRRMSPSTRNIYVARPGRRGGHPWRDPRGPLGELHQDPARRGRGEPNG
jgi:hypothetical protein